MIHAACDAPVDEVMNVMARILDAMKQSLLSLLAVLLSATGLFADTVAYWNFKSPSSPTASSRGVGGIPTSIAANLGTGTLLREVYAGKVDDFNGSTTNATAPDARNSDRSTFQADPAEFTRSPSH